MRVLQHGTGDAESLTLTTAEVHASVANAGVIAVLQVHDELMGIGDFGGLDNFLLRHVLHAEGDIIKYGVVEEDGVLRNDAH